MKHLDARRVDDGKIAAIGAADDEGAAGACPVRARREDGAACSTLAARVQDKVAVLQPSAYYHLCASKNDRKMKAQQGLPSYRLHGKREGWVRNPESPARVQIATLQIAPKQVNGRCSGAAFQDRHQAVHSPHLTLIKHEVAVRLREEVHESIGRVQPCVLHRTAAKLAASVHPG